MEGKTYFKDYFEKKLELKFNGDSVSHAESPSYADPKGPAGSAIADSAIAGPVKKNWICEKRFGKEIDGTEAFSPTRDKQFAKTIFEDHYHLTGTYRGLAHNEGNLKSQRFTPHLYQYFSTTHLHMVFC